MPVLGNFPNNKVKLNQAVNIAIAPVWGPDERKVELFPTFMTGTIMYMMHISTVATSNTFVMELARYMNKG